MDFLTTLLRDKLFGQLGGLAFFGMVIWFASPLIPFRGGHPFESEFNRLLLIAILFGGFALYKLIASKRAGQKNQKLMTQLSMPAVSPERASIEEAQSEEIAVLRQRFSEALQMLAKSQPGAKGGKKTLLYALPWYVIIGGPGCGKTTLLLNSGLTFPLSEKESVKGVGGTRNCDWFFADDAVFIDTAGRYTTQDSYQPVDKAAWTNFLGLLKKYRPRRPLNGLLLAMSMPELMEMSEEDRSKRARELRLRISELYEILANRFPVYMIFTKCDLIAGFNDFFSDITQEERAQVWGETFLSEGAKQQHEKLIAKFEGNCEEVILGLNLWTLKRIQDERDTNRRGVIFCFPQQLSQIKPTVSAFLRELFVTTRFEKEALLRGVYFTSGTQEGTPIDRIMGMLASIYGMERQELPAFRGRPKSFFINRLLKEVVLPEAELAGMDPRLERRRRWARIAVYALLLLTCGGLMSLWSLSYFNNAYAIARVNEKIKELYKYPAGTATPEKALRGMIGRLNVLHETLQIYGKRSWTNGFYLYQGDKVNAGIKDIYQTRLNEDLLPEIGRRLREMMKRQMLKRDFDSGFLYELLRTYLMFGRPDKMDKKLATDTIRKLWVRGEMDYSKDPKFWKALDLHTAELLKSSLEAPLDKELIEKVRGKISSVPPALQLYNTLKSEAAADRSSDFRLLEAVPRSRNVFTTVDGRRLEDVSIPGFFTREGYNAYFKKQGLDLVKRTMKENWVLEQHGDEVSLYYQIQNMYFKEYEDYWKNLLGNLRIQPRDIMDTINILREISVQRDPGNPLPKFLNEVEKNTNLVGSADSGQTSSPLGKETEISSDPVYMLGEHFKNINQLVKQAPGGQTQLDEVVKAAYDLYEQMVFLIREARDNPEEALERILKGMNEYVGAQNALRNAILKFDVLPDPVNLWLRPLTTSGQKTTLESAKAELNRAWKTDVINPYNKMIKGKYPIYGKGRDFITKEDFCRFFAPRGILEQFVEKNVKSYTDSLKRLATQDRTSQISQQALTQFQNAAKIREAFFAGGESTLRIGFSLKPLDLDTHVSSFEISIEGKTLKYERDNPEPQGFSWPGPNPELGVVITFKPLEGEPVKTEFSGDDWSWFRVLDRYRPRRVSDKYYQITFSNEDYTARFGLQTSRVDNPFSLLYPPDGSSILHQFYCPEQLL